jgi:hypothetical protein
MADLKVQDKIRHALEKLAAATEKSCLRPPADAATVRLVDITLNKAGYAALPEDYAFLLTQACGLQGPYFTLLGPGGMKTAEGGIQPGIHQESEAFNAGADEAEKPLVLGRASGNALLVFAEGEYRLVDAQSRDVLCTYDGIAAFIADMIALKDKARTTAGDRSHLDER